MKVMLHITLDLPNSVYFHVRFSGETYRFRRQPDDGLRHRQELLFEWQGNLRRLIRPDLLIGTTS